LRVLSFEYRVLRKNKINIIIWFLLILTVACQSSESRKIVMKIAHNANIEHSYQVGYEAMGRELARAGHDNIDFQIFPASQIGEEEEAIEMIKLGVIASTPANIGAIGSFVPEADLFNFPFLFRNLEHFYKVVDGPVGDQIARKIEENLDCLVLGWWFSGARNVWNSERPIHKPNDLKGLKIRVIASPVILESFDALGAQSTSMSFGELYSAVQQGVLDGAECDLTDIHGMKFYEVTKYVSSTEHLFLAVALLYSKKQYDLLSPEVQKVVRRAGKNSEKIQREAMELKTRESLIELEKLGLIFNKVDKRPFQTLAWEVYQNNAEKVGGMALIENILNQ